MNVKLIILCVILSLVGCNKYSEERTDDFVLPATLSGCAIHKLVGVHRSLYVVHCPNATTTTIHNCGKGCTHSNTVIDEGGMKKSAKGLLRVEKEGDNYVLYDQQTKEQETQGELKTVFKDGKLVKETSLSEIRNRLWGVIYGV